MFRAAITALIVFAGSPALAATAKSLAFDLDCAGQITAAQGAPSPFTMRLSIDLAHKRWCYVDAKCPLVFPVLSAGGDDLRLLDVKTEYNEAALQVNLGTGAFVQKIRLPQRAGSETTATGVCARAAFTPPSKPPAGVPLRAKGR